MGSEGTLSTAADALCLAGTLMLLLRALDQRLRATKGPEAFASAELDVLGQIDRGSDLPSQVARALRLDPARVTHLTDRLVARGYIERAIDPQDRRCWRLHLTALGTQRLAEGRGDVSAAMETLLDGLLEEERAGLIRGLAGVRRVLGTLPPTAPAAL